MIGKIVTITKGEFSDVEFKVMVIYEYLQDGSTRLMAKKLSDGSLISFYPIDILEIDKQTKIAK